MAGDLHRDLIGVTGAHEVPYGRPPQVVRDPPWAPGLQAHRLPRLAQRCDGLWLLRPTPALGHHAEEDPRFNSASLLQLVVLGFLRLQQLAQLAREGKHAAGFSAIMTAMRAVVRIPPTLRQAIRRGRLTPSQVTHLIRVEAKALGLSPAQAVARARAGTLPRHYIADDLALLVQLRNGSRP